MELKSQTRCTKTDRETSLCVFHLIDCFVPIQSMFPYDLKWKPILFFFFFFCVALSIIYWDWFVCLISTGNSTRDPIPVWLNHIEKMITDKHFSITFKKKKQVNWRLCSSWFRETLSHLGQGIQCFSAKKKSLIQWNRSEKTHILASFSEKEQKMTNGPTIQGLLERPFMFSFGM